MKGSWASGQWPSYSELIVPFRERDVHVKGSLAITSLSPCKGLMALVIFPFGFVTLAISSSAFSIFQIQIYPHFSVPVNGNWGAWRPWSTCTKTCGGGVKRRTRTCSNPAPKNGGRACTGSSAESQACNTSPCKGKRLQLLSSFFFRFCCCWCCFSWNRSCFYFFCCCNDIWLKKIPTLKTIRMLQNMIVSLFFFLFVFGFFFFNL